MFQLFRNFIATALLVALAIGPAAMIAIQHKEIATSLGLADWRVSSLYAVFFLGSGLGIRIIDRLVTWLGLIWALRLGALVTTATGLTGFYFPNAIVFSICFIPFSLAVAPTLMKLLGRVSTWTPQFPALSLAGVTFGQLVAFWPWERVLAWAGAEWGWTSGLLVLAIGGLAQLGLIQFISPQLVHPADQGAPTPHPRHDAWPFILNGFCVIGGTTIVLLSLKTLEAAQGVAGSVSLFAAFSIAALVGRFLFAASCDFGHARGSIISAFAVIFFAIGLIRCAGPSPAILLAGAGLLGFGYAGYLPALVANVTLFCRGPAATNRESVLVWGSAGIALGSPIAGTLLATNSISRGLDVAVLSFAFGAALLFRAFKL